MNALDFLGSFRDREAERGAGDQFIHLWIPPTCPKASWGLAVAATEMNRHKPSLEEPGETQTSTLAQ